MSLFKKIGAVVAIGALLSSNFAVTVLASSKFSVTQWEYVGSPAECNGTVGVNSVTSKWDYGIGKPAPSLLLEKTGNISNCASAGATINGINGQILSELNFNYLGYCGNGSPRFNVYTSNGYYFFGCTNGIHTPGLTNADWTHVQFKNPDAIPGTPETPPWPGFGNVIVTGIDFVFDEIGTIHADNFNINGQIIGGPTTDQQKESCKNDGFKNYDKIVGIGPFKTQSDCLNHFAAK